MKKFSKEAMLLASAERVTDIAIEFNMRLFEKLKERRPQEAAELQEDYEAYIRATSEFQHRTKGHYTINDVVRSLPGNRWADFLKPIIELIPRSRLMRRMPEPTERDREAWAEKTAKHLLKWDIH